MVVNTVLLMQGLQVPSLFRELRSHMLYSMANKTPPKIQDLEMFDIEGCDGKDRKQRFDECFRITKPVRSPLCICLIHVEHRQSRPKIV